MIDYLNVGKVILQGGQVVWLLPFPCKPIGFYTNLDDPLYERFYWSHPLFTGFYFSPCVFSHLQIPCHCSSSLDLSKQIKLFWR